MKKKTKRAILITTVSIISLGLFVVTVGLLADNIGVTYTLDKDIKVTKLDEKLKIVNDSGYPGVSVKKIDSNVNEYKVLAFTDLHLDHNKETCNYTFSMLARNIINEKPDLVVFCGDNITSSFNKPRTKQFAQLLEDLGVYWSAVLGNHEKNADNPFSIARDRMLNIWAGYPHCLIDNTTKKTSSGDNVWGVGNHVINLLGNNNEVTQSLFFLDSGTELSKSDTSKYKNEIQEGFKDRNKSSSYYDYIKDSQVTWYKETFKTIRDKSSDKTRSSIFTHVPIIEQENTYLEMFNDGQGVGNHENIGAFKDLDQNECKSFEDLLKKDGYLKNPNDSTHLRRREDMCYSPHDYHYNTEGTPIFNAMKEFGDNNAFFCGHDHQNNFTLKRDGVIMSYVQPGGYSSNNLFTKGMLSTDAYKPDENHHLIQGYTRLTYSDKQLSNLENIENYNTFGSEYYQKVIKLIEKQRGKYKGDKSSEYFK